jgi:hypothetical protein
MPTLYLHIGPHKTGSTYLQTMFADQENALKAQGIFYPSTGRELPYGHHNMAWFFMNRALIKTTRDDLARNMLLLANTFQQYKILFSSEEFARIPENKLTKLKNTFPEHDFHTLYFMRTGIGLVTSLWQEMIKQGHVIPLDKIELPEMCNFFNYNPFAHAENIAKFEKHLKGPVTVYNYNQLMAEDKDLLDVMSSTLNVNLQSEHKTVNASMSIEAIELFRAANLYNLSIGKPRRGLPRTKCVAMLRAPNGVALKSYVAEKVKELAQNLPGKHFLDTGFADAQLTAADLTKEYVFVPGNLLLEQLNQDDIQPWKILKSQIEA